MPYRLRITEQATPALRQMPQHLARDAVEMILALAEDPYPPHALAMSDSLHGRYRMRVNGWRVIYLVHEQGSSGCDCSCPSVHAEHLPQCAVVKKSKSRGKQFPGSFCFR